MYDLKSSSVSHPSLIPAFFNQKPDLLATNSLTKMLKMLGYSAIIFMLNVNI